MQWEFTAYAVPLLAGAVVIGGVVAAAWPQRNTLGGLGFVLLGLSIITYALGYALEISSLSIAQVQLWLKVQYLGVATAPVATLLVVLYFTNRHGWLSPTKYGVLLFVPLMTILFAWTNEAHELIWRDLHINTSGGFTRTLFERGGWYWVNDVFLYVVVTVAVGTLLKTLPNLERIYRRQLITLLAAIALPMLAHFLYVVGLFPDGLDVNPYALLLTGIIVSWAILDYMLLDVMPVAQEAVLVNMKDAVIVLDKKKRVVYFNNAARTLAPRQMKAAIGQPVEVVFPSCAEAVRPTLTHEETHSEITLETATEPRIYEAHVSPLKGWRQQPRGFLLVLHDITSRKQSEAALKTANSELQHAVDELDSFAQTVAHDLKNPLGRIMGFAEMLMDDYDEFSQEEIMQQLEIVFQSSAKAVQIIESLLLLASVRKQEEIPLQPLDMGHIVDEVLIDLGQQIQEREAQIEVAERWPQVQGYPVWVEEIWANYLSNALKYGGGHIEIGYDAGKNGQIRFWVRDDGPGLSSEQQQRLFEPFTRINQAKVKGHGLGLSIVQRIVSRLDGQAGVESKLGEGSLFYFTLPAIEPENDTST